MDERVNLAREGVLQKALPVFWRDQYFFTACLDTVGWFTIRSGERDTKDMERAYIFGTPQNDSRQSVGGNTFVEILLRNYGRTPGHLWRGFPATEPFGYRVY